MATLSPRSWLFVSPALLFVVGVFGGSVGCSGEGAETSEPSPAKAPVVLVENKGNQKLQGTASPAPDVPVATCAQAAAEHSNAGCDFWPTVTRNPVWSVFDFAIVVANGNAKETKIRVQRGKQVVAEGVVPANNVGTFPVPWVKELKGDDYDVCIDVTEPSFSAVVPEGAYHLTSDLPITAFQFSPLEYKSGEGDKWRGCPDVTTCSKAPKPPGCFSFSNDASLLLPSSVWTTNYRVTGKANSDGPIGSAQAEGSPVTTGTITITAAQDGTDVTVKVNDQLQGTTNGVPIPDTEAGGVVTLKLNAGDVAALNGFNILTNDLSGSLVQSTKPVQVIFSLGCAYNPTTATDSCDHVEETVWPAESLGKHYVVAPPTSPTGKVVGHTVRLYGNKDNTKLTYQGTAPAGAPTTIQAGQVVDFVGTTAQGVTGAFEVTGDHEFAVASFQLGNNALDPSNKDDRGDPSMTLLAPVEQFRKSYVFLAPSDYDVSYVDVTHGKDVKLILDGVAVNVAPTLVSPTYAVTRILLPASKTTGTHAISASTPIGIQVMGYGLYTSYQYPGGANVTAVAPPPPPVSIH